MVVHLEVNPNSRNILQKCRLNDMGDVIRDAPPSIRAYLLLPLDSDRWIAYGGIFNPPYAAGLVCMEVSLRKRR